MSCGLRLPLIPKATVRLSICAEPASHKARSMVHLDEQSPFLDLQPASRGTGDSLPLTRPSRAGPLQLYPITSKSQQSTLGLHKFCSFVLEPCTQHAGCASQVRAITLHGPARGSGPASVRLLDLCPGAPRFRLQDFSSIPPPPPLDPPPA